MCQWKLNNVVVPKYLIVVVPFVRQFTILGYENAQKSIYPNNQSRGRYWKNITQVMYNKYDFRVIQDVFQRLEAEILGKTME